MNNKGLTDKFLKGAFKLGAYLGAGTLSASLMACDHLPVPISVSGERYIAYATTENGDIYSLRDGPYQVNPETTMNLSLVTFDTVTNSVVSTHDLPGPPLMLTNSKNSAAYIVPGEEDSTNIAFLNNGKLKTIKNASFPQLSSSGDCLAYTKMNENKAELYLDYFKTGTVRKHGAMGIPIAFSPDLSKLLFFGESEDEESGSMGIHYRHLSSGTSNHVVDANLMEMSEKDLLQFPQWVGNDRVLYTSKPTESSSDHEIFVADLRGNEIRITDNYLAEVSPQISKQGTIFYVGKDVKKEVGTESPVYFSRTEKGFWKSHKSDFSAQWLRVAGKNLIYSKNTGQVYSAPLEDVVNGETKNVVNISQKIVTNQKSGEAINGLIRTVFGN